MSATRCLARPRLGALALFVLLPACASSFERAQPVSLVIRTGSGCAAGCALDRPLLVGTTEIADILDDVEIRAARVDDAAIVAASIERVSLCCAGGTCHVADAATLWCEGETDERARLVLRALVPGIALIELLDAAGRVVRVAPLEVASASDVSVSPAIDHLELGDVAHATIVAIDGEGRHLFASRGVFVSITDRSMLALSALPSSSGDTIEDDEIAIGAVGAGTSMLRLRASSAERSFAIRVTAGEPPADACETDADCVPDACCHPDACVAIERAPACGEARCTTECRGGTLDCGGRCLCVDGRCAAQLPSWPREP